MENIDIPELNKKIGQLIEGLGFTSSKFADHIEVSRPIISHIIAGRNKPSLDIIQRILLKFPDLGIAWTFDGNDIAKDVLIEIANGRVEDSLGTKKTEESLSMSLGQDKNKRDAVIATPRIEAGIRPTKVVVLNDDQSFQEFSYSNQTDGSINHCKQISKIVVFLDDNSFRDFNPA